MRVGLMTAWDMNKDDDLTTIKFVALVDKWPTEVVGILVGDLAIHEDLNNEGHEWRITHIPTLTMFDKALPSGSRDKAHLIDWCKRVQDATRNLQLQNDWALLRSLTHDNYRSREAEVIACKDRIMKHCRDIPVVDNWR